MHLTICGMRVGIDSRLPYYRMGGISQYIINLIQALVNLPGEEEYIIFKSRKDSRDYLPSQASERFKTARLWTPSHHRFEKWSLSGELIPHRLDVMHSPDFIPPALGARRLIITIHDLAFLYYPEFLTDESRRYYSEQIRWAVSAADHISVDSEATRIDLVNLLDVNPGKITTIHLAASPVHTAVYDQQSIEATLVEYSLAKGFILCVGTLEPRKNIPMLLRAYHQLIQKRSNPPSLVLVGGKGWLFEEIFQTINDYGLNAHIRHLGALPDVQLAHLYRAAGVLAFPSFYEGFGFPALEAMHAGCPVIVSNRGSLGEIVGNAAIGLDPEDVEGWAEALDLVFSDERLVGRLKEAGFIQAKRFTWAKTARATLDLYRGEA
jgi:glycosyltransferase involved in cell wall biosynthesis